MRIQISSTSRKHLGARLVVASVSGGKDSTALALTLMENEIPHVRVFADTGFEAPETYRYLDLLRTRLGPIEVVRNEALWRDALPGEEGMLTLIRRKKMFPSRLMRFCTQQLKIFPIRDHLRALQDRGDDVVSAVGVRAEESAARSQMAEWEFWDEMDAEAPIPKALAKSDIRREVFGGGEAEPLSLVRKTSDCGTVRTAVSLARNSRLWPGRAPLLPGCDPLSIDRSPLSAGLGCSASRSASRGRNA